MQIVTSLAILGIVGISQLDLCCTASESTNSSRCDRKYKSASNWFIFLLFYPPHGSRACQWWGHRGWGSSTQKLVSMSSFRSPPVANMKSVFFSEMHHHLDDRNVAVTLESLLDVPQQVLLVHAGSCVDVGVHLAKFNIHWKTTNFHTFRTL